jgi:hypothetical protein
VCEVPRHVGQIISRVTALAPDEVPLDKLDTQATVWVRPGGNESATCCHRWTALAYGKRRYRRDECFQG